MPATACELDPGSPDNESPCSQENCPAGATFPSTVPEKRSNLSLLSLPGAKSGTILINTELLRAPIYCIDYVIIHELCHMIIYDQGPEFFRHLSRVMPDWRMRKHRLDGSVICEMDKGHYPEWH